MNQKSISKKISIVIIVVLAFEVIVFAGWYITQPSYTATIATIVKQHESPDQSYFYVSLSNKSSSLDSIYNAVNIYANLQQLNQVNSKKVTSQVLSAFNSSTGLFAENGNSSLLSTFDAVSTLSILGETSLLNKTAIINGVLKLQTNDSLFRDYSEDNVSEILGEVDHLYQAVTTLNILIPNQTELSSLINETKMIESMSSLEDGNGEIHEGVLYSTNQSSATLRDAYYFTETLLLINKSPNISSLSSKFIRYNDLENWVQNLYSDKGFKIQSSSEPSVEATAYAFIVLRDLGMPASEIQRLFPDGVSSIVNFLNTNFITDTTHNTLDILNDILQSLIQLNQLSSLNKPYFNQDSQFFFSSLIAATIFLFIINTLVNMFFMLGEDDSKYFEGKLHTVIEKILEGDRKDLSGLSVLLGDEIESIEISSIENEEKLALMKAYSKNFTFVITYETFNGLAKKVEKFATVNNELLAVLDFLESDIFFTVEEGILQLKAIPKNSTTN